MNKWKKGLVLVPDDFKEVDWLSKIKESGLNTLGIHSGGGEAHDVVAGLGAFADQPFRDQIAAAGLDWEYELHASRQLMPESLFEIHPEYFIQTSRSKIRVKVRNWCVSSSGTLDVVSENAAKLAGRLPSSTGNYFMWGCDIEPGKDWCSCLECARYSFSEQNLLTSNAIARRLRQEDPKAKVCAIAYHSTLPAPRRIYPEENVFCEYAPYLRNYDYALCDLRCAINREHVRHLMDLLAIYTPERMHILEYWLDASLWGKPGEPHLPPFNREIAEADIRFYTSLGIRNITTFAVGQNGRYMAQYGDRLFWEYAEILARYA